MNVLVQVCVKRIAGHRDANKPQIRDATRPLMAPGPPDPASPES